MNTIQSNETQRAIRISRQVRVMKTNGAKDRLLAEMRGVK